MNALSRQEQSRKSVFASEAELCAVFISSLPEGWTAYPETAGFDILLVREADGAQLGIEAKMTLNAKVLLQSVEGMYSRWDSAGPDWRAALVPYGTAGAEMKRIARLLGITVIEARAAGEGDKEVERQVAKYGEQYRRFASRDYEPFQPELPVLGGRWRTEWVDHCPVERAKLPDYVPDVAAGAPAPTTLSEWKVKAIKICVILEKRGFLVVSDFKHISIDRKRWLDMRWIKMTEQRGRYVAGLRPLDLKKQHPVNYSQIEADFDTWAKGLPAVQPVQEDLL